MFRETLNNLEEYRGTLCEIFPEASWDELQTVFQSALDQWSVYYGEILCDQGAPLMGVSTTNRFIERQINALKKCRDSLREETDQAVSLQAKLNGLWQAFGRKPEGRLFDCAIVDAILVNQSNAVDQLLGLVGSAFDTICHRRDIRETDIGDLKQEFIARVLFERKDGAEPKISHYLGEGRLKTYVSVAFSRFCLDWIKANKHRPKATFEEDRENERDALERSQHSQAAVDLMIELEQMPEEDRLIIQLYYFDKIPNNLIAQQLGKSPGQLTRIRKAAEGRLKSRLS